MRKRLKATLFKCIGAMALLAAMHAHAADLVHGFIPLDNQSVRYDAGREICVSRMQSTVSISLSPINSRDAWVTVAIENGSGQTTNFLDSRISASSNGAQIPIKFAQEIIKSEKRRQVWEDVATGLAAGLNSYAAESAGNYSESGYASGTVRSGVSRSDFDMMYRAHGTDPAARQRAREQAWSQNQQMTQELESDQSERLNSIASSLLVSQTLDPGTFHVGRIQIRVPRSSRKAGQIVNLTIPFGSELHSFLFWVHHTPTEAERENALAAFRPDAPDSTASTAAYTPLPTQQDTTEVARTTPAANVRHAIDLYEKNDRQGYATAAEILQQAHQTGDGVATFNLGISYLLGLGVERDLSKATQLFDIAAQRGVLRGLAYSASISAASEDQLIEPFTKCATSGDEFCRLILGMLLIKDERSKKVGIDYLQSISGGASAFSLMAKGLLLDENSQRDEAFPHYLAAAKAGLQQAQIRVAGSYLEGEGGAPFDPSAGVFWMRKAANQGMPLAMVSLAIIYDGGEGVPERPTERHFWALLAARHDRRYEALPEHARESLTQTEIARNEQRAAKWSPVAGSKQVLFIEPH